MRVAAPVRLVAWSLAGMAGSITALFAGAALMHGVTAGRVLLVIGGLAAWAGCMLSFAALGLFDTAVRLLRDLDDDGPG